MFIISSPLLVLGIYFYIWLGVNVVPGFLINGFYVNVEELSQVVGFLELDKSLLINGHNEAADMAELQTTLNGCLLEYV
jgi:hypothetical protein